MLSNVEILAAIERGEIAIATFDPTNENDSRLTPAGFNFSFTKFIVSMNDKMFYRIYEDEPEDGKSNLYFIIGAGDTALALTKESIWVSKKYAGTFHSKVRYVSQGLGHISTTLDPGWMGQLLISVNNPNRRSIKVNIGQKDCATGEITYATFLTLCLYKLEVAASGLSDNSNARLDILYDLLAENRDTNPNEMLRLLQKLNSIRAICAVQSSNELISLDQWTATNKQTFEDDHAIVLKKLDSLQPRINSMIGSVPEPNTFKVKVKKLRDDAVVPKLEYPGDAGMDLFSIDEVTINPQSTVLVHTGLSIELPQNTEAQIRPRSGLAKEFGVTVLNSPGTIDAGYRGEIGVLIINHGKEPFKIERHMRIAQLVIKPIMNIEMVEATELSESIRGRGGFGSSGVD